ncbi:Golgi SNAP receptor complex member 2 [Trichoplax sp. H2]|nr:Golgi SNAP receptor complex member 2 [Trichoplax sp. H2]|eukprot:RDD39884.1 Golgi SNAP receptor complex member 2 [Trichoplax sp. H2]
MDILLNQTNRLIHEIQSYLQQIAYQDDEQAKVSENGITCRLQQLSTNCEKLQIQVSKLPAAQRQNVKYRIDQVVYDYKHLQSGYNQYLQAKETKQREAREREELLSQDYKTNA